MSRRAALASPKISQTSRKFGFVSLLPAPAQRSNGRSRNSGFLSHINTLGYRAVTPRAVWRQTPIDRRHASAHPYRPLVALTSHQWRHPRPSTVMAVGGGKAGTEWEWVTELPMYKKKNGALHFLSVYQMWPQLMCRCVCTCQTWKRLNLFRNDSIC